MPKIHPTAIVDPAAKLGDEVEIGAYSIVEGDVTLGPGCVLREHAVIRSHTHMGAGNFVDSGAVIGGLPQDLGFKPDTVTYIKIGDQNIFREGVTISRATKPGLATTIGNRNYFMTCSHMGHDAAVGDDTIFVNGAVAAGHTHIGSRVFLSAHVGVHQFTWVGDGVMTRGNSGVSMHVPPFTMLAEINGIVGLNVIGMRRNPQLTDEDRKQIKEAFYLTYRSGLPMTKVLAEMDLRVDWGAAAGNFREFVRKVLAAEKPYRRGLCPMRHKKNQSEKSD
jgi:UDP-N-acetylglucosamine acyltransferase